MSLPWNRFADASAYAAQIHARQVRKGTTIPYISHLMSVSALVLEHGGNEDQAIAGLLHDAIEDIGVEQEAIILDRYGSRVAHIVRACTDADTIPKPPWRARKEVYLAHLESADDEVLLVSCADKLHNSRAILSDLNTVGASVFDRFSASQEETLWYYQALAAVFLRRLQNPISKRLSATVGALVQASAAAKGGRL